MFRLSGLLSIFLAVMCGTLLFWTSQSVQKAERQLSDTEQIVENEREALRVLSTEWDYLNRPERLDSLVRHNFDLEEVGAEKESYLLEANNIPEPLIPAVPSRKPRSLLQLISNKRLKHKKVYKKEFREDTSANFNKVLSGAAIEDTP